MGNKSVRIICGSVLSVITLLFVVFPFMIKVDMAEIATGRERFGSADKHGNHRFNQIETNQAISDGNELPVIQEENSITKDYGDEHHKINQEIEVKGYNTLNEISDLYDIPVHVITEKLKIPESTSGSSKLGHLRKQYGFTMSDIELIIHNYKNK